MGTLYLVVSLVFAILGNVAVKLSRGFEKKIASVLAFALFSICFYLLTMSLQYIDISVAYATWAGVSIAATTIIGILLFNERADMKKNLSILLILAGVVLLQFTR
ncbi:DMT family transporter [Alkalicoccus saliphilus]|uniref:QacE family quaternary ammonium compound efflux SMR transporter n=1 Tax=Alkalicoccus saliphilus TaxID=200989 RepID=A0A2T4U6M7_9BACI|nr:multidrug efflux SMR transporter [Alkalicoccus saliphilus]PTL39052.1 hypothetical protein C6Y45_07675 [Alkalicoccus saliphilus]